MRKQTSNSYILPGTPRISSIFSIYFLALVGRSSYVLIPSVHVCQPGIVMYSTLIKRKPSRSYTDYSSVLLIHTCTLDNCATLDGNDSNFFPFKLYPTANLISFSVSKISSLVTQIAVYPLTMLVYCKRKTSSQPHLLFLFVVTPYSWPLDWSNSPISWKYWHIKKPILMPNNYKYLHHVTL